MVKRMLSNDAGFCRKSSNMQIVADDKCYSCLTLIPEIVNFAFKIYRNIAMKAEFDLEMHYLFF